MIIIVIYALRFAFVVFVFLPIIPQHAEQEDKEETGQQDVAKEGKAVHQKSPVS
jgi:hypothetical protein